MQSFREKWERAEEAAYDLLLEACRSRAIEIVMKPRLVSMGVVEVPPRAGYFPIRLASKLWLTRPHRLGVEVAIQIDVPMQPF